MTITLEIKNAYSQIKGLDDLSVIDAVSKELSYMAGYLSWAQKNSGWDGTYRLLNRRQQFPSGCVPRVRKVLDEYGLKYEISDQRQYREPKTGLKWIGPPLYEYQKEIVDICIAKKAGMVKSCTGSGKTLMISKLVCEYNLPTVIYVVSSDLLQQMHDELKNSIEAPIGIVGGGICDIQNITVCSAWTAGRAYNKKEMPSADEIAEDKWTPNQEQKKRIREMVEAAELCVLDEAQFAAAESIKTILANSKSASHRFGFSGTPWRTEGDDILLEAAFGERICDLPASKLIRLGYLVPAKFVFKEIPKIDGLGEKWAQVKSDYIVNNKVRNEILITATLKLIELGRKPLILFREHKHGKILRDMLPPHIKYRYVTGKVDPEERRRIREEFKSGDVQLILASTVYDQGVDLPPLDALILAGGGKSTAKALQRVGRVIRGFKEGGKKDAIVVDTFDQANHARKHSFLRWQIYKTEEEFLFKTTPGFDSYIKRMEQYGRQKGFDS